MPARRQSTKLWSYPETRRSPAKAIDFHQGDEIDEEALKALIRAAVALNASSAGRRPGDEGVDPQ
jgi:hypothetical protein